MRRRGRRRVPRCVGAIPPDELDLDGDGFLACEECDDGEAGIWPGAEEVCDGLDTDCSGAPASDEVDGDGDGFLACAECDDADLLIFPGAPERCNELDDDCDGEVDEGSLRVPEDYGTIQEAIDARTFGDTVCVGPGIWFEALLVADLPLTLIGSTGAAAALLSGVDYFDGTRIVVQSSAGAASFTGLTVTTAGSGLHAVEVDLELHAMVFQDLVGTGKAVWVDGGSATISDTVFSDLHGLSPQARSTSNTWIS